MTNFRFNFLCEVSWACMEAMKRNQGWRTFTGKIFDVRCGVPLLVLSMLGDETSRSLRSLPRALESLNPLKLWAHPGPSSPTMEPQTVFFLGKEGTTWQ